MCRPRSPRLGLPRRRRGRDGAHRRRAGVPQAGDDLRRAAHRATAAPAPATPTRSAPAARAVLVDAARPPAAAADRRGRPTGSRRSGTTCSPRPAPPRSARSPRSRSPRSTPRCGICARRAPACRCGGWPAASAATCRSTTPRAAGCTCPPTSWSRARSPRRRPGLAGREGQDRQADRSRGRERLAAVREAVGPGFDIMVDANQSMTATEAIRRAAAVRAARPRLVRGAAAGRRHRGPRALAARRPRSRSPSASRCTPSAQFREYLDRGAAGIVQVDVARIGGITPWLKVAHLAEAFNVHGLPALPDGAARQPRRRGAERPLRRAHPAAAGDHAAPRSTIEDGHALAPETVGLGIDWDRDAIEDRRVA